MIFDKRIRVSGDEDRSQTRRNDTGHEEKHSRMDVDQLAGFKEERRLRRIEIIKQKRGRNRMDGESAQACSKVSYGHGKEGSLAMFRFLSRRENNEK